MAGATAPRLLSLSASAAAVITASGRRASAIVTTLNYNIHRLILAFAIIVLDHELHAVPISNTAIPIKKRRDVAEEVISALVWFDEAKALLIIPPQHLASS